jgi:hypothetical protein
MIDIPTVLVLGAGASAPLGFPTGQGLKKQICSRDFRQGSTVQVLNTLGFESDSIGSFTHALNQSGRPSVDAFLEYRNDFLDIGKAAIAVVLLPLEKTGTLFKPENSNWYELLFGVLCDGTPFEKVDQNKLSVITFNYDRSLEQYLFTALKNSYNKSDKECAGKLSRFPIVHVHGSLGALPWQTGSLIPVVYDSEGETACVGRAASNIKIIPEATIDTPEFHQAHKLISEAERLMFLGFGYHPKNMERLVPQSVKVPKDVAGTSLDLSYDRTQFILEWARELNGKVGSFITRDIYTFLHRHISLNAHR